MDLRFGKDLNNNRNNIKQNIINKSKIEGFDNFNNNLEDMGTAAKQFYNDYNLIKDNVLKCKGKCKLKYIGTDISTINKLKACNVGCHLNGPYYKACTDTYKGYKQNNSKKCDDFTKNRCLGGKIHNDGNIIMGDEYSDYEGRTLKDGCCSCGGGIHGKPKAKIGGAYIQNCEQLPNALGLNAINNQNLINICKDVPFDNINISKGLMSKYKIFEDLNHTLDNTMDKIYNKIFGIKKFNKNVDFKDNDININNLMDKYEIMYDKLNKIKANETHTLTAQLENIMNKTNASSTRYNMYIGSIILVLIMYSYYKFK